MVRPAPLILNRKKRLSRRRARTRLGLGTGDRVPPPLKVGDQSSPNRRPSRAPSLAQRKRENGKETSLNYN